MGSGGSARARIGLTLLAMLMLAAPAQADDFKVKNLHDHGPGSLRKGIARAQANPGADRVLFKRGVSGTIRLTSGELLVSDSAVVEIIGPGPGRVTINAGGDSRVFSVVQSADVTISGLRLVRGEGQGGGLNAHNSFNVALVNAIVADNTGDRGAGISQRNGELLIKRSTIKGNEADTIGGGLLTAEFASTRVVNSTISGNSAFGGGGGVAATGVDMTLTSSTVAVNGTGDNGGGILATRADGTQVDLRGTIVADNGAAGAGKDLYADPMSSFGAAFSLIERPGNSGISGAGSNITGLGPKLRALADNGGKTPTHAIKRGSPARNAGASDAPNRDQRGVARRGQPDIGAYEFVG